MFFKSLSEHLLRLKSYALFSAFQIVSQASRTFLAFILKALLTLITPVMANAQTSQDTIPISTIAHTVHASSHKGLSNIDIELGTSELPINKLVQFTVNLKVNTQVPEIDSVSIDLNGSWADFDGGMSHIVEINETDSVIVVTLNRAAGDPVTGYGHMLRVSVSGLQFPTGQVFEAVVSGGMIMVENVDAFKKTGPDSMLFHDFPKDMATFEVIISDFSGKNILEYVGDRRESLYQIIRKLPYGLYLAVVLQGDRKRTYRFFKHN